MQGSADARGPRPMKSALRILAVALIVLGLVQWSGRRVESILYFAAASGLFALTETTFDDGPIAWRSLSRTLLERRLPVSIVGKVAGYLSMLLLLLHFALLFAS
jgi:hypothetical protein